MRIGILAVARGAEGTPFLQQGAGGGAPCALFMDFKYDFMYLQAPEPVCVAAGCGVCARARARALDGCVLGV